MENKNKVGGVVDRRFGEDDFNLSPEEKMLERFTKERQVFLILKFNESINGLQDDLYYFRFSTIETIEIIYF